jgi:hypothetical protein
MIKRKVKILVDAKNDLYSGPEKIEVADGGSIDAISLFPAGTIGFVDEVFEHETDVLVNIFHNEDSESDARLGSVFVKKDEIEG